MVGREDRDLGDALEGAGADRGRERLAVAVGLADEFGMLDLLRQVDAQPVGR